MTLFERPVPKAFTLLLTLGGSHPRQRSPPLPALLRFLLQRLRLWDVDSRTVQETVGKDPQQRRRRCPEAAAVVPTFSETNLFLVFVQF